MHWVDEIAERLLRKGDRHVIASGTSISGEIHLGNAGDVIIADAVARAVRQRGGHGQVLWIADDVDPLRKLPPQVGAVGVIGPDALGKPVNALPCPEGPGHCASFTQHFTKPFLAELERIGVRPAPLSGSTMYADGRYGVMAKMALGQAADIRRILHEVSGTTKPDDWLPFEAICGKCGKLTPTHAHAFIGGKVRYRCVGGVAGKQRIDGCGHEGEAELTGGKLVWRVEWAARWAILGVTCEPFGKEHAAAGGSYDTSKLIAEQVFATPAPEPVIYEHIQVGGRKMSKSLGNVLTLGDLLEVAPPEMVRYFYFRTKISKHKEFDITKNLLPLIEEYERVERLYFGGEAPSAQDDLPDLKRTYELAQVDGADIPAPPIRQVPFSHLITVCQLAADDAKLRAVLDRTGLARELSPAWEAVLTTKQQCARRWIALYVPESERFAVQPTLPDGAVDALDPGQRAFIRVLLPKLETAEWRAESIHAAVHGTAKELKLPPADAFAALYRIFLDRARGPRLGFLLESIGSGSVIERLRAAIDAGA